MLELQAINASYGATAVLHDLSFAAELGQITTLIGANGAGKTTTLNCVAGVLRPTSGKILWQGRDISQLRPPDVVRLGISLIPEGLHVFPQMTVADNLEMGAYTRADKAGMRRDFDWVLHLFPKLKSRLAQMAGTLSGGEQQMLAVGRALMAAPKLILMDEPSMGLAPVVVEEVFRVIEEIRKESRTILLVEQNASLALNLAHQAYFIELGRVVLSGSGRELLHNPAVEKSYLGV
jgi:branched-chain amino acid transport system ATP-binding protein